MAWSGEWRPICPSDHADADLTWSSGSCEESEGGETRPHEKRVPGPKDAMAMPPPPSAHLRERGKECQHALGGDDGERHGLAEGGDVAQRHDARKPVVALRLRAKKSGEGEEGGEEWEGGEGRGRGAHAF